MSKTNVRYEDNPKPIVDCSNDVPLTQQSDAAECDINTIVARAKGGADVSRLTRPGGVYGDFRNLPDFRTSLLIVTEANERFMSLDAQVRKRFNNDPAQLLDFLGDDKNREEAVKLGLLRPYEAPKVDEHLETLKSIDKRLGEGSGGKKSKPKGDDE